MCNIILEVGSAFIVINIKKDFYMQWEYLGQPENKDSNAIDF